MAGLFAAAAEGYATARPPVHPRVIELARPWLAAPVDRALDVGCGAGLSTRALADLATQCIGLEPEAPMLAWARTVAPRAGFVAGAAERIPIRSRSIDLLTAAGSLNFADLDAFFPEATRVLTAQGKLLVYDFGAGREFAGSRGLTEWFEGFRQRYPPPEGLGRPLDPEILSNLRSGFRVSAREYFAIAIRIDADFYANYLMTETNVASAIRDGAEEGEIREWCLEGARDVFGGRPRDVVFRGCAALLEPESE